MRVLQPQESIWVTSLRIAELRSGHKPDGLFSYASNNEVAAFSTPRRLSILRALSPWLFLKYTDTCTANAKACAFCFQKDILVARVADDSASLAENVSANL